MAELSPAPFLLDESRGRQGLILYINNESGKNMITELAEYIAKALAEEIGLSPSLLGNLQGRKNSLDFYKQVCKNYT
jgi:hypothetical protein